MSLNSIGKLGLTIAVGIAGASSAHASIDLTLNLGSSLYETGFNGGYAQPADAIGIYSFSTRGTTGTTLPSTIYSVCLSPEGYVNGSTHTYTEETFAQANPGFFPSSWASGKGANGQTQYWGIQNAAFLWEKYGMNIVDQSTHGLGLVGNSKEEAAALQFAIWDVLYNSKGYATLGGKSYTTPFNELDRNEQSDYNLYLKALTSAGPNMPLYSGDILVGSGAPGNGEDGGDDQEFFLLGEPTPEPSTIVTGVLMLVPLGASACRKLRKSSAVAS